MAPRQQCSTYHSGWCNFGTTRYRRSNFIWRTGNSLHSFNFRDIITKVAPLCLGQQAPSHESHFTLLAYVSYQCSFNNAIYSRTIASTASTSDLRDDVQHVQINQCLVVASEIKNQNFPVKNVSVSSMKQIKQTNVEHKTLRKYRGPLVRPTDM